ncbi:Putative B3 domain-containing protein Os03g0621600 [Linum perenne]
MAAPGQDGQRWLEKGTIFIRVIRQSTVRDRKMMIPPQLSWNVLSRSATLIVSNGQQWGVEVIRNNEGIWFCNKGWQRFAEFYSLDFGHFLVFKYKGHSIFSVRIFDRTTSVEIDYPIYNGEETDGGADVADELNKRKSPIENNEEILQGSNSDHATGEPSSSRELIRITDGFTSERPFFRIQMNSSYTSRGQPHIPLSFADEHISKEEEWVKLEVGDKVWRIGLSVQQNKDVTLSRGWRSFVGDNSLKPGDVCIFELMNGWTNIRMKVNILKGDDV